ncbi:MAG: hypothetical protein ACRD1Q_02955, partial [Vicinamibacterales bacterium]
MRKQGSAEFDRRRTVTAGVLAAAMGLAWLATVPVSGQAPHWTTPKTSWGEPDLQGTYTNTYENGTSFERPDEFTGRRLEDIKGEELAAMRRAIQRRTIANFEGPIHAPDNWWQDNLFLERGSQAWFVVDPPDGKIPPLTPEASERQAARAAARRSSGRGPADSYEDRSLYDRCISRGLPGSMLPAIYGNQYQIVQSPGYVAILYEMIHETRVIPVNGGPHLGEHIRSHMGDGRGRWEGDTLVVETTNFRDESAYRGANTKTLRLIERFTRIAPNQVRWAVTVDDPQTWTKPWTFAMPLTRDSTPLPAYECHEGNYGLRNILSAARADERRAAATTTNAIPSG